MMDTLTIIAISLAVSFVLSELFFRFKYPRVLGQLMAGIILGLPIINQIFSEGARIDIAFLADLGVVFLLLLTGLELNLQKFKKAEKDAMWVAIFCAIIPFFLGFALMKAVGYNNIIALITAGCFSLTAEGTSLKLFMDMKVLNTRLGVIMIGAGILDDVLEIIFLSLTLLLAHKASISVALLPVKLLLFIIIVYVTYKTFPFMLRIIQKERSRIATLSFIIIFGIIVAVISKKLGLGAIVGAFIAGIIIHLSEHRKYEHKENIRELEGITFALIIPFFFINIGLHFDVVTFAQNIWLVLMVVVVATLGKLLGAMAAVPFANITMKQANLIGWGMNSRGAVELVIAELARANGLIPIEVYSAIVAMAVFTTLLFPIVLKKMIKNDRSILN